jgi:hypothetical protein
MIDRLDEERLEILRSWGIGLASDDREELRAAGKAITVLIEEIDRCRSTSGMREPSSASRASHSSLLPQGVALRDRLARHRPQV